MEYPKSPKIKPFWHLILCFWGSWTSNIQEPPPAPNPLTFFWKLYASVDRFGDGTQNQREYTWMGHGVSMS